MKKMVTELRVFDKDNTIFDTDIEYIIPLYQRSFAWKERHIIQLIEDIKSIKLHSNYYLGTLIVSINNDKYEVIDGQQRLTSLFLLLNCLDINVKNTIIFECREKSNYTLKNIRDLIDNDGKNLDIDRIEENITKAIKIIKELKRTLDIDNFIKQLSRIIIYRIEVPEHTDLNRYFETMNTRGEQLEQSDILKAKLMNFLKNKNDRKIFSIIWDACSDMNGYIQMHLVCKNNKIRNQIFNENWDKIPSNKWSDYEFLIDCNNETEDGYSIKNIIKPDFKIESEDGYRDDDAKVRFESIIEFPYFLLHVLKVYAGIKKIKHKNKNDDILHEFLDDKKLLDSFNNVIEFGISKNNTIKQNIEYFVKKFALCLLRTRFIFDKYIIKREYTNGSFNGEWSLKSLHASGQKSKKKPYYKNTRCVYSYGRETTNTIINKNNLMLQSALRVSYTSPKSMHWITKLLLWLSKDNCKNIDENICKFTNAIENIARKAVVRDFFNDSPDGEFTKGVDTPHIVFNYLDYLIWKSDRDGKKYGKFEFEFRNSVEHWYPQHPSEGTFEEWKDGIDSFGNLCIVQRYVNSKFSNMSPEAKKSTFENMINNGSLKLRIMSNLTEKDNERNASLRWKEELYKIHEKEMIEILRKNCSQFLD